eukprot:5948773-Heterocapsa_arctica.AAC.1
MRWQSQALVIEHGREGEDLENADEEKKGVLAWKNEYNGLDDGYRRAAIMHGQRVRAVENLVEVGLDR